MSFSRFASGIPVDRRVWLLLVMALALGGVRPASAHVSLRSTTPADGDTLQAPPEEIRLQFSGPVLVQYTRATLIGPDGRAVAEGQLDEVSESGRREFVLPVDAEFSRGRYMVRWRTAAEDGHPIEGSFAFVLDIEDDEIDGGAAGEDEVREEAPHHPEEVGSFNALSAESPLSVAIRLLHYLALLALVGGVAFHYGVTRRMHRDDRVRSLQSDVEGRNRRLLAAGLALLAVVLLARAWAQSARLHGFSDALEPTNIWTMLTSTTWGYGWLLQLAGAVITLLGVILLRSTSRRAGGWTVAAIGAVALAVVPALSGHAAAVESWTVAALLVHSVHVLGAAVWLGSLAALLVIGLPAMTQAASGRRMTATAAVVGLFSPVALTGAVLAGASGVANALFHFNAVSELWTTAYGTALLAKLAALGVAAGLGLYHWRFVLPWLHEQESPRRFRLTAGAELAAGLAVLVATALFVVLPTPG